MTLSTVAKLILKQDLINNLSKSANNSVLCIL